MVIPLLFTMRQPIDAIFIVSVVNKLKFLFFERDYLISLRRHLLIEVLLDYEERIVNAGTIELLRFLCRFSDSRQMF
jgi:hypothetical protein